MRKVTATILWNHKTNQIYNLTVTTRENIDICLIRYTPADDPAPYKYNTLNDLIKSVLQLLENNNFYMTGYKQFGMTFFPLLFVDINYPYEFNKYGYKEI